MGHQEWRKPSGWVSLAAAAGLAVMCAGGCGGSGSITTPATTGIPVVVDTDLALDSVMALLYLLGRPELDVRAITVSGTGEVHCDSGVRIAAGLLALAGADGVPVACGPEQPLEGANAFPAEWREAADGAWGLELPEGAAPSGLPAPSLLAAVIGASEEPVLVFTEGPLTNLAAALRLNPGLVADVAMTYVMGGAIDAAGNALANPEAEFNIWVDPVAAAEVLTSGVPLTLVPLDATNQVPLTAAHLQALSEHQSTPEAAAVVRALQANFRDGLFFWDPVAAAVLVDESLASFETMRLAVVTEGGPQAAGTIKRTAEGSEVRVVSEIDADRFAREFLSALAGEDVGPIRAVLPTPATTVEELTAALHAALGAQDAAAYRALFAVGARQVFYLVEGKTGRFVDDLVILAGDPATDPLQSMEVLGNPVVSGNVAAIPVRYTLRLEQPRVVVGFDVVVGVPAPQGGLLIGGVASLVADPGLEVDLAVARSLVEAEGAAWNAGDVGGVLATMGEDAVLWDPTAPDEILTGPALEGLLASLIPNLSLEVAGPPLVSGPFFVVAERITDRASGSGPYAVAVYWIRDGLTALRVIAAAG